MQLGWRSLVRPELAVHAEECRAFYAARGERRGPASLEELQEARARQVPAPLPATVAVEQVEDASGRGIPLRILMPKNTKPRAVYLDIPGGGFYLSSAAAGDARNLELAESLGIAVVSVDYRLAPENPWPAAPDDCEAAALWLIDHAEARFGTTDAGDRRQLGRSHAGHDDAAPAPGRRAACIRFVGAALQFGTYDLSARTPAGRLIADEYFLRAYVGHVADRTVPDVSPGLRRPA